MSPSRRIQDLPTPALLLDWPTAQRNNRTAARMVEGTGARLRPHFKSHKCVLIALEQLAAGNCAGMTAATVDEAWALVDGRTRQERGDVGEEGGDSAGPALRWLASLSRRCGHIQDDGERASYARETMNLAVETRRLIEASGLLCPIVSGTGTGTFRAVLDLAGLTELQVGTYVLMDWAFKERTGNLFEIALTVLATVITASSDQFVLDVGMKGLGNRSGAPRFPDLAGYEVLQCNAEEHTIVRLPRHRLCVGDQVRIMPSHANGTLNLYRQIVVNEGETVRHIWPISATGYELLAGNVG
jgi:D-serine deaminase-like pyridoxal phosphate-dependent protein